MEREAAEADAGTIGVGPGEDDAREDGASGLPVVSKPAGRGRGGGRAVPKAKRAKTSPNAGSVGQEKTKRHWQLCELVAAVRAVLFVQESSGTSSQKNRIEPTFAAYTAACERAVEEGTWTNDFTVAQSCEWRNKRVSEGGKGEDCLVHHKYLEMKRLVANEVVPEYKLLMAQTFDTLTYVLPSGKTQEQVLQELLLARFGGG